MNKRDFEKPNPSFPDIHINIGILGQNPRHEDGVAKGERTDDPEPPRRKLAEDERPTPKNTCLKRDKAPFKLMDVRN